MIRNLTSSGLGRWIALGHLIEHLRTPLYRNAYALTMSSVLTSVLGILYWVLAARYYPPDVVGLNSAAIAATLFLAGVAGLYLDGAFLRFIPRAGLSAGRLILYGYLVSTTAAALLSIVFLLGLNLWSPALAFLTRSQWSIIWFILATMSTVIFVMQDGALTALRQTLWVPLENTVYAIAKIVLLIFFATTFAEYGIFASWTIPAALLTIPVNLLIFRSLLKRHHHSTKDIAVPVHLPQVFHYVAGNYVGFLFFLAYTKLLPLLVIYQLGSRANAYFYLPWVIVTSLQLVTTNMSMSLVVESSMDETRLRSNMRRALIHTARLLIPVIIVLVVTAPFILHLFGTDYLEESTETLRLMLLGLIPNIVFVLFMGFSRVQRRIRRIIVLQAMLATLVLGLSYILLPLYGIAGVGWAWLASQLIVALTLLLTQLAPLSTRRAILPLPLRTGGNDKSGE